VRLAHRLQLQGQPRHWEELPHRIPIQAPKGTGAICEVR
jgi:hypothetical protein